MNRKRVTRRSAMGGVGSMVAASPFVNGQALIGEPPGRITPRQELVNVLEFENVAQRKLSTEAYQAIAGSNHTPFERITFQPRMLVNTQGLTLNAELFGQKMFAPILVGPMSQQKTFHPDGELATVRGSSAAKTTMVVSSQSSCDIETIAEQAKTTLWYQAYVDADTAVVRAGIQKAVKYGCKAVIVTVGTPYGALGSGQVSTPAKLPRMASPALNWGMIDQLRQGLSVPFLLKGIMSPEEAQEAVQKGVQGIVVSNYGGLLTTGQASAIEMLPLVVDAAGAKVPVLVDGSFRRGTDILKALAFGAKGVLIGRPVLWGLAAYGADGVQTLLEMLQTELARNMVMCGTPDLKSIDRDVIKVHALPPQARV